MAKNFSIALNMILNSAEYTQNLKKVQGVTQDWANKVTGALAGTFALDSIFSFVKSAVQGYNDAAQANAKMNAVLLSTGGIAGVTGEAIKKMTSDIGDKTLFSKTSLTDAAAVLLTFTKIGKDIFPQVMTSAANMSTVLGTDLHQSIIQLGKALNSPETGMMALKKSGVSFTESQIEMIKKLQESGDLMGAQNIILAELKTEFDGAAEAAAKAGTGPIEMITKKFMSLKKAIGEAIVESADFQKALAKIADTLSNVVYAALNKNMSEWESWKVLLEGIFGSSDNGQEVNRIIDFYKTLESLGMDSVSIQKEINKRIAEDEKAKLKESLSNNKEATQTKEDLIWKIKDLEDEVQKTRPLTGQAEGVDEWLTKAKNLKIYKDLLSDIYAQEEAKKKKLIVNELTDEEKYKAAKEAYAKEKELLDQNNNYKLNALEEAYNSETYSDWEHKRTLILIAIDYYKKQIELLKKYGKDYSKELLLLSKEKGKMSYRSDNALMKPKGGQSVTSNLMTGNAAGTLMPMQDQVKRYSDNETDKAKKKAQEQIDSVNAIIKDGVNSMIGETAALLGDAFGKILAGGNTAKAFEEFGKGIVSSIGKFLVKIGEGLIAYAFAMDTFKKAFTNPYSAIGAGLALIVLGSALSSMAAAGPSGAGSSGAGSSGASSSGYSTPSTAQANNNVVFEIHGSKLVGVLSNFDRKNKNIS